MDSKPFYASKTFWFNAALLTGTFLVDLPKELKELGVPESSAVMVATVGNMILRFLSVARITFGK